MLVWLWVMGDAGTMAAGGAPMECGLAHSPAWPVPVYAAALAVAGVAGAGERRVCPRHRGVPVHSFFLPTVN